MPKVGRPRSCYTGELKVEQLDRSAPSPKVMTVHNYIQGLLREVLAAVTETESPLVSFSVPEAVTISVSTDEEGLVSPEGKDCGRVCFTVMVVPTLKTCGVN